MKKQINNQNVLSESKDLKKNEIYANCNHAKFSFCILKKKKKFKQLIGDNLSFINC